jgi:hypothetical protein
MTKQVYQTAQGQSVDLGAIVLKNEHVRAVGNMNVNARGDKIDGDNRVVDERSQQTQRQAERTTVKATNVAATQVHTSNSHAKRTREQALAQALIDQQAQPVDDPVVDIEDPVVEDPAPVEADPVEATPEPEVTATPVEPPPPPPPPKTVTVDDTSGQGGLASAIARSKVIEQEKLKTPKQIAKAKPGVTRI